MARIVNIWKSLPNIVIDIDYVDLFKLRLVRFWKHQDVRYDYKTEITRTRPDIDQENRMKENFELQLCSKSRYGHRGRKCLHWFILLTD